MYVSDFVLNGQGYGPVGGVMAQMGASRFEPGLLRPYLDGRDRPCVTINTGRKDNQGKWIRQKREVNELMTHGVMSPVFNATAMRRDEWMMFDQVVEKAVRPRMRAWGDLAAANSFSVPGMSKSVLVGTSMTAFGEALVDMDGVSEGRQDRPRYQDRGLPLPITHMDFFFTQRELMESRASGQPLDTTSVSEAAEKVAEKVEKTTIGTETGVAYGDQPYGSTTYFDQAPQVYGYTNYPDRITKTDLTTPTGANPEAVMTDVLEMRDLLYNDHFYGPFVVYHSTSYDRYFDDDYFRTGSTAMSQTLRQRILAIGDVSAVRRLDYLTSGFVLIMVSMQAKVAQAVNGLDITTVQWEEKGGMRLHFKVMAVLVPRLRSVFNQDDDTMVTGIVHGTVS